VVPFEVAVPGDYELHVDAYAGPEGGDYALELDGAPLPDLAGYAPVVTPLHGEPTHRTLDAGRHVLVARCTGRHPASQGYDARLDALVGAPAEN
jgi:hypothetical protein